MFGDAFITHHYWILIDLINQNWSAEFDETNQNTWGRFNFNPSMDKYLHAW